MKGINFFHGMKEEDIQKILNTSNERLYSSGTIIFSEGQETEGIYIIRSLIKVYKMSVDGRKRPGHIEPGDILGEMALFITIFAHTAKP